MDGYEEFMDGDEDMVDGSFFVGSVVNGYSSPHYELQFSREIEFPDELFRAVRDAWMTPHVVEVTISMPALD